MNRLVEAKRDAIVDALAVQINAAVRDQLITTGLLWGGLECKLAVENAADLQALYPYDAKLMTKFAIKMGFNEDNVVLTCDPKYYQDKTVLEVLLKRI